MRLSNTFSVESYAWMVRMINRLSQGLGSRNPIENAQNRLLRAHNRAIATELSKLTWAVQTRDQAAIKMYQAHVAEFAQVAGTATEQFLSREQGADVPMRSFWHILNPLSEKSAPLSLPVPNDSIPAYEISSSTLATAYRYLTQSHPKARAKDQEPEWMLLLTGLRRGNLRTLEQIVVVKLDHQEFAQASFDMDNFQKVARSLDKHGQAIHMIAHSHRFDGRPTPSHVDWRTQDILDQAYTIIQCVFSEDGFVRFFARNPFTVTVSGKGVKTVDRKNHLYKITEFESLPFLSYRN